MFRQHVIRWVYWSSEKWHVLISGPFSYLILRHVYIEIVSTSLTVPFIRSVKTGGKSCRKHAVVVIPCLKHTAAKLRHALR
jgi:hypothetical protein